MCSIIAGRASRAFFVTCALCAAQIPAAAASAVPDRARPRVDAQAVGATASLDAEACTAALPPKVPGAVPHTASNGQPAWTAKQAREVCSSDEPMSPQQGSNSTPAAREDGALTQRASSPASPLPSQSWTHSSLFSAVRQPPHETAGSLVQVDPGSLAQNNVQGADRVRPDPDGATFAHSSFSFLPTADQNLACMPAPYCQKPTRLKQMQNSPPGDSCSNSPWQLEHSSVLCKKDGPVADSLLSRAASRDSVLSFEALATRSHASGLDLSTVCWLISGHPE